MGICYTLMLVPSAFKFYFMCFWQKNLFCSKDLTWSYITVNLKIFPVIYLGKTSIITSSFTILVR